MSDDKKPSAGTKISVTMHDDSPAAEPSADAPAKAVVITKRSMLKSPDTVPAESTEPTPVSGENPAPKTAPTLTNKSVIKPLSISVDTEKPDKADKSDKPDESEASKEDPKAKVDDQPTSSIKIVTEPGESLEAPATPDESPAPKPEAEAKPEDSQPAPAPEKSAKEAPAPEPAAETPSPDTTSSDSPSDEKTEDTDSDGKDAAQQTEAEITAAAEAQNKHDEAVQKLVDGKQYYLPINAVEKRKTKHFVILGVVLSVLLLLTWADIALDAGLVQIPGVKPVTHFFSN